MIDPVALDEILDVLREQNVASFSCPEFSVTLSPGAPVDSEDDIGDAIEEANAALRTPTVPGLFNHPKLWAGGKPPSFPKAGE